MLNRNAQKIALFESKVKALIEKHKVLKLKNQDLTAELEYTKTELMKAHKTILELQEERNHLCTANALAATTEERIKAKDRLGKMVREIDKCIALLKE